ncbi:MAG: hypothetical protein AAGF07_01955 [Patescibacteria group bacterium]
MILSSVRIITILELLVFLLVAAVHLVHLDNLPRGLYLDESSIGLNAATIADKGEDEFGQNYPLYFKAFGEYKNPVYIYSAAAVFYFFDVSVYNLRLTSAIFFILALLLIWILVKRIFADNRYINFYTLIGFGFLPHYFNISRVAFELISYLTFMSLFLLLQYLTFEGQSKLDESEKTSLIHKLLLSALTGISLGVSIYTYSTARLLSFVFLSTLGVIYFSRENISKLLLVVIFFLLTVSPWIVYINQNPDHLTGRFAEISYLTDASTSILTKAGTFVFEYLRYFNPNFLWFQGDANLRHTIGRGGLVYISVLLLFLLSVYKYFCKQFPNHNKHILFLLTSAFFSIAPAALTNDGTPHALRSLTLSLFVFLCSCYGFHWLVKDNKYKSVGLALVFGLLVIESLCFVDYYFKAYPNKSRAAFESYGILESLQSFHSDNPQSPKVVLSTSIHQAQTHLNFFKYVLDSDLSYVSIEEPIPQENTCIIYDPKDQESLDSNSTLEFVNHNQNDWFVKTRCYK